MHREGDLIEQKEKSLLPDVMVCQGWMTLMYLEVCWDLSIFTIPKPSHKQLTINNGWIHEWTTWYLADPWSD